MGATRTVDLKQCTLVIRDGTPTTPNEVIVNLGAGTITWTEAYAYDYQLNRGSLNGVSVRKGDDTPCQLDFGAAFIKYTSRTGDAGPTPVDAMKQTGLASTWVATNTADNCAPYCVDVIIMNIPGSCGDTEIYTFNEFRVESINPDFSAGTFSFSGKIPYSAPQVVTRAYSSTYDSMYEA